MSGEEDTLLPHPDRRHDDPRIKKLAADLDGVQGYVERINQQQAAMAKLQTEMQASIDNNTSITTAIASDTLLIREAVAGAKALWDFFGRAGRWFVKAAKVIGTLATAAAAVYALLELAANIDVGAAISKIWRR